MPTANVYVDGFNLYYRCLKHSPYRWLDISRLATLLLPGATINRIRYFTARVQSLPYDPDAPTRQQVYLRALETIPNLSIHLGHFLTNRKKMRLVNPPANGPATVEVYSTEEKGSDVNIATYLLLDAFKKEAATALLFSNDSDLAEPVRIVREEFGVNVFVTHPCRGAPSHTLQKAAGSNVRRIRNGSLASSQFPAHLTDNAGMFTKPATW